jgi:hypothetical protein
VPQRRRVGCRIHRRPGDPVTDLLMPGSCILAIALIAITAVIRAFILEGQRDKARAQAAENERRAEAFERHAIRCNTERDEAITALRLAVERENWRELSRRMPGRFNWHTNGGEA